MDWKALYFEAVCALIAMKGRAEQAEARSLPTTARWKLDPEVLALSEREHSLKLLAGMKSVLEEHPEPLMLFPLPHVATHK